MGPWSCIGDSTQLMVYHLVHIWTTSPIWDLTTQHNGFLAPHAEAQCGHFWTMARVVKDESLQIPTHNWYKKIETVLWDKKKPALYVQ